MASLRSSQVIRGGYPSNVTVDHEGDEYVYVQLASILRGRIRSGDLPPGRALPSARMLSQQYEVAIGTVKKAIEGLRSDGLVHTVIGRGIFVTRPPQKLHSKFA